MVSLLDGKTSAELMKNYFDPRTKQIWLNEVFSFGFALQ